MIGELLALASAVSFGLAGVAIAKGALTSSGASGVLLSVLMTGTLAGLAWAVTGSSVLMNGALPLTAVGWFAASGLLATVGGRLTMFRAIELAGVIRAATIRRLTPFLSLVLGWLILGELISWVSGSGMALIAASFVLLYIDNRRKLEDAAPTRTVSRGLAFGAISALLYAVSYVARKFGLIDLPNAYFGVLVGALAAILYYLAGCAVSGGYRRLVRESLSRPNPWQLAAGFLISIGQITQFAALTHIGVARVAFINSVEIYISALLAVFVFKTEGMPSLPVILATVLATVGVILVAMG